MKKIELILVDDHTLFREMLASNLTKSGYKIRNQFGESASLLKSLKHNNLPDLIILDLNMPGLDGLSAIERLKLKYRNKVKILVLSMYNESILIKNVIDSGANGYISKSVDYNETLLAIEQVIKNDFYVSPQTSSILIKGNQCVDSDLLNDVELSIVSLICREFTNKEISQRLNLKESTVSTYRTQILRKLNVQNTAGLVVYAIKNKFHSV